MKNSCPSRALSALSKSVLVKPALTLPRSHKWLLLPYAFEDLRYFLYHDAVTTFGRYEPEVWTAAASRMMQFVEIGYADPIEFFIENLGTFCMYGHPAFFTLTFQPILTGRQRVMRDWNVIQFAVVVPPSYYRELDWAPPEGVLERFALDFVPDHIRYGT